jgi:molecular chaperone Hsp33
LIPESRLYTFIDGSREFALYFLEGQCLIQEVALIHPIRGTGFAYFRDVLLSVQPMVALLKGGEQFGFYIDSEEPYFRLKIETAHNGSTRCMLLPESFQEFPEAMRGLVRLHKLQPGRAPYESVLEAKGLPLREIVNQVLRDSYQVNCAMMLSEASDQSVMLHQLPPLTRKDEYEYSPAAVRSRREGIRESVRAIFAKALHDEDGIVSVFAEIGFRLLAHRAMRVQCSCSRERMVENLRPVYQQEGDGLFEPGADDLEVVCEYCKSRYRVGRRELASPAPGLH